MRRLEIEAQRERLSLLLDHDPHNPEVQALHDSLLQLSVVYFAKCYLNFAVGPHHLEWDALTEHKRVCILASRDCGKSYFWSFAHVLWRLVVKNPGEFGILISGTKEAAEFFLEKVRDELETNPVFQHLVPAVRDKAAKAKVWAQSRLKLTNGSTLRAYGFRTKIRGKHPSWVVGDDMLSDDDIYSELQRRRNIDFFLSAVAGMVHRSKPLFVVGTPLHERDLYGNLRKNKQYTFRTYPIEDKDGRPLWPQRYSRADIQAKKDELGSKTRFAREYLVIALSDEASLFPSKFFNEGGVRLPYRLGLPADYWAKQGFPRYMGVDIAVSAEVGADYFVVFTIAVDPFGNRWLVNIFRDKGMSFQDQLTTIESEYRRFRPERIHIEANQAQRVWSDELIRTTDLPIVRYFTTGVGGVQPTGGWKKGATASISANKNDLEKGVPGLRLLFENRKWRIPNLQPGDPGYDDLEQWIGEMGAIGFVDGKVQSTGEHDDAPMACWMANTAAEIGGGLLGFSPTKVAPSAQQEPPQAAPVVSQREMAQYDYTQDALDALAAAQAGHKVTVSADAYLALVRRQLVGQRDRAVEGHDLKQAHHLITEIARLDKLHNFRPYEGPGGDAARYDRAIDSPQKPDADKLEDSGFFFL